MNAEEWLKVIQQAEDYPHHLTPLIKKYGEMLLDETPVSDEQDEMWNDIIDIAGKIVYYQEAEMDKETDEIIQKLKSKYIISKK